MCVGGLYFFVGCSSFVHSSNPAFLFYVGEKHMYTLVRTGYCMLIYISIHNDEYVCMYTHMHTHTHTHTYCTHTWCKNYASHSLANLMRALRKNK